MYLFVVLYHDLSLYSIVSLYRNLSRVSVLYHIVALYGNLLCWMVTELCIVIDHDLL